SAAGPRLALARLVERSRRDDVRVRVARHTDNLEAVVAFYRDRVGLPEIGRFTDHDGYDGVFLDLPGTRTHLDFTTGGDHRAVARTSSQASTRIATGPA